MNRVALAILLAAGSGGCGDERTALEKSCAGDVLPNCRPYEYSVVTAASLTPSEVEVGDPVTDVDVHLEIDHCGERSPSPHRIAVEAFASASGGLDAGATDRIFMLANLRDDGTTAGDATALDGLIDVTIPNPFFGDVPASSDMTLRFVPRIDLCQGETAEIPYRTGPRYEPPMP